MNRFDEEILAIAQNLNYAYTRYADDMTFSGENPGARSEILEHVRVTLLNLDSPSLILNDNKTVFVSKAHRRRVTGLILSNDNRVSLGRDRKRNIRAQVHRIYS